MKEKTIPLIKYQFSTRWYKSRFETLKAIGSIDKFNRQEVFGRWRSILKKQRKKKSIRELAQFFGMGITAIQKDLKYLRLSDCHLSDKVYERGTGTFLDDPYGMASEQFSYDPEKGVIKCLKVSNISAIENVGKTVKVGSVCVRGRVLSVQQLSWLLHYKKMPDGKIHSRTRGSLKIEDLYIKVATTCNVDKAAHREKITVLGREKWIDVDSSRHVPRTLAEKKRASGECKGCGNYDWCLDGMFKKRCIGKIACKTDQDSMRQRAKSVLDELRMEVG